MGRMMAAEVVALHGAGEALADGRAGHIDDLADLEPVDLELEACLQVLAFTLAQPEFHQAATRAHGGLRQMARARLAQQLRALGLHGAVAVRVLGLELGDPVGQYFYDGHRDGFAGVGKHRVIPALLPTRPIEFFMG